MIAQACNEDGLVQHVRVMTHEPEENLSLTKAENNKDTRIDQ